MSSDQNSSAADWVVDGVEGLALWARADRVLPGGGIYLSRSARFAGEGVLPGFVRDAMGCRVVDADGRKYIDFICANGPNLLGYGHPAVQEAFLEQARRPASMNFFSPSMIELAEQLVERHPGQDWAVLAKTGSEVVTLACRVARKATGRSLIVAFNQAYHGSDAELSPWPPPGVPSSRLDDIVRLPWNDAPALEEFCRDHSGKIAGVLFNALDQNSFQPTRFAEPGFVRAIAEAGRKTGAALILDDVRQGFRMNPRGSHHALGIDPDLLCLGKGLGNGYSVSALLGRDALREGARGIMFTSSLHFEQPPMQAAMATLQAYDREDAFGAMTRAGSRLRAGIEAAAVETGHAIDFSGPPAMPTLLFEDDPDHSRGMWFSREAARRGVLIHPGLNGFLCAAHDDESIDEALFAVEEALAATPLPAG
ncbi:MAG: aminotransferase class III-fold pyridoxal phosphate-dependent enzyme [Myxococcota bacterium]|nr:aminotransferase class III-fold pyridoxal phosphate-dependent enzyme [Myxococcota bacterium]